jgi:hypothetical protein
MAIGAAVVVDTGKPGVVRRHVPKHVAHDEMKRFDRAVKLAAQGLREHAPNRRSSRPTWR